MREEVQWRGQWKTMASVRRYEKRASLLRVIGRLPPQGKAFGEKILENLESFMLHPELIPAPPVKIR